jgi:hypothetical protein
MRLGSNDLTAENETAGGGQPSITDHPEASGGEAFGTAPVFYETGRLAGTAATAGRM